MSAQAEFQLVCDTWDAFNRDDFEDGLSRIHEDAVVVPFGAAMEGKSYKGHDGILDWFRNDIRANWEQFHTHARDFRKVGDTLVVFGQWRARGRDSGVVLEVPATWAVKIRDGKIAYWQTFTDRDEALAFVGLHK